MTTEPHQVNTETARRRDWKWWLRWIFASYAIAVGTVILLTICSMPVLGLARTVDVFFDNAGPIMLVFTILGAGVTYRYLN